MYNGLDNSQYLKTIASEKRKSFWFGMFTATVMWLVILFFGVFTVFAYYIPNRVNMLVKQQMVGNQVITPMVQPNVPSQVPPKKATITLTVKPTATYTAPVGTPQDKTVCLQLATFNNAFVSQSVQDWALCVAKQKALLISHINSPGSSPLMQQELSKIQAMGY